MTAPELRPYQRDVIEQFHGAVAAGKRRIILVAPTGAARPSSPPTSSTRPRARKIGPSCWRIGARSSRRPPTSCANGIYPGIIMAGVQPRPLELVQLASDPDLWIAKPAQRQDGVCRPPNWW